MEDNMLKLIFENKKKINKLGRKIRRNGQTELLFILVGMYVLAKVTANQEIEIINLKKAFEEMNSKGA